VIDYRLGSVDETFLPSLVENGHRQHAQRLRNFFRSRIDMTSRETAHTRMNEPRGVVANHAG